jgi:hypothetical protein
MQPILSSHHYQFAMDQIQATPAMCADYPTTYKSAPFLLFHSTVMKTTTPTLILRTVSNIDSSQSLGVCCFILITLHGWLTPRAAILQFQCVAVQHLHLQLNTALALFPPCFSKDSERYILFQKFVQGTKWHKIHCVYKTTTPVLPCRKSRYLKFSEVGQFQAREQGGVSIL